MRSALLCISLLLLTSTAQATTVTKCVDAAGKVTFSQHGCPQSATSADALKVKNPTPSGSSNPSQMAPAPGASARSASAARTSGLQPRASSSAKPRSRCMRCRFR